jgi:diamine N-acetyltransferase
MFEDCYLREISHSDIKVIHAWRNDKDVVEGLGSPYRYVNIETEESWFATYQNNRSTQVRLGIVNQKNNELIGMVSLLQIDFLAKSAELALQIGNKTFWGRGIGKWATRLIVSHAFENLNLNRVYLYVLVKNECAQAVYKSVGFQKEGLLRQAIFKCGGYKDLVIMSILREEFILSDGN